MHKFCSAVNVESDAGSVPEMRLLPKSLRRAKGRCKRCTHVLQTTRHTHTQSHAQATCKSARTRSRYHHSHCPQTQRDTHRHTHKRTHKHKAEERHLSLTLSHGQGTASPTSKPILIERAAPRAIRPAAPLLGLDRVQPVARQRSSVQLLAACAVRNGIHRAQVALGCNTCAAASRLCCAEVDATDFRQQ
jgi:hypothetical protein